MCIAILTKITANSLYLSFSPCKATNLIAWCHRKQSLLILFTMQSYKSHYMVSPQTVFTYPFHHAKLQISLHGVTANSLYLSFSPCKATNLHYMVSPQTVFTYPFHHAKLQIFLTTMEGKLALLRWILATCTHQLITGQKKPTGPVYDETDRLYHQLVITRTVGFISMLRGNPFGPLVCHFTYAKHSGFFSCLLFFWHLKMYRYINYM